MSLCFISMRASTVQSVKLFRSVSGNGILKGDILANYGCYGIRSNEGYFTQRRFYVEVQKENISRFARLKQMLKEEGRRYLNGTKQLWRNMKEVNNLKKKEPQNLTRAEWKLIQTTKVDIKMAIPFLILFVTPVVGYTVPFLVAAMPGLLPSTFSDDAFKKKQYHTADKKRKEITPILTDSLTKQLSTEEREKFLKTLRESKLTSDRFLSASSYLEFRPLLIRLKLENLERSEIVYIAKFLLFPFSFLPTFMLQSWIKNKVNYLQKDDQLIGISGLGKLDKLAQLEACYERGLPVNEELTEKQLESWLKVSEKTEKGVDPMILIYYAVVLNASQT